MMRPPNEKKLKSEEQTELERRREAREEYASRRIRECYYEASVLRERIGAPYLAMTSRPATYACLDCANHYLPRGISESNPYLRHEHVTTAELDRDPALELAIADAKRTTPHPLESAARPMSPSERQAMVRAIRESVFGVTVAARVEP